MAHKKVKKSQSKIKKKAWVTLKAPAIFGGHELGETMVDDPKSAIGRHISVNLMTLVRDPKKQGINVRFQVVAIHSTHASTIFNRYRVMPSSIKRMVRRNKDRIDHSFKCKTQDGVTLTIKPVVLTMNKCNKSVTQAIRKKVVSFIYYHVNKKSLDQIVQDIIQTKIQFALKKSLSKIYPVAICELREVSVSSYGDAVLDAVKQDQGTSEKEETAEQETAEQETADEETADEETTDEETTDEETTDEETKEAKAREPAAKKTEPSQDESEDSDIPKKRISDSAEKKTKEPKKPAKTAKSTSQKE